MKISLHCFVMHILLWPCPVSEMWLIDWCLRWLKHCSMHCAVHEWKLRIYISEQWKKHKNLITLPLKTKQNLFAMLLRLWGTVFLLIEFKWNVGWLKIWLLIQLLCWNLTSLAKRSDVMGSGNCVATKTQPAQTQPFPPLILQFHLK